MTKSSFHFERINEVDSDFSNWQSLSFVCPLKYHMTLLLLFYSSNPKARAKMAGIVNKVFLTRGTQREYSSKPLKHSILVFKR